MRIALVSAHYPPNFVSGGTLVPQRSAQTLAARGHQVFVFAGELLPGEPDLTVRTEVVDPGAIEITWVSSNGFLGWEDDRNHANSAVEAAFLTFLRRVRPDVVHLHTLQGLGGGLVPLAAASGGATVVTMHDLWWWCARQFLVEQTGPRDDDLRPCSSVVDCGVCPCSVDEAWRVRRNGVLADRLAAADLVLAPSTPMLDLLAANGVDPARLALDENPAPDVEVNPRGAGLPGRPGPEAPGQVTGPVRFVFAGGRYPVKGGPLALAAAGLLRDLGGWTLDLYGLDPAGPTRSLPPHVRVCPPYPADTARQVLATYDVLVMSSVMLESYSLLTREALAAGCAVITGDNPGPTEIVHDGLNGLVVPRGDAAALAAAMRTLVLDRRLLRRLRPAPGSLVLRTLDQQADGLLAHYQRILDRKQADREPTSADASGDQAQTGLPTLQRVVLLSGIDGAPVRYRGHLPAEALAEVGVHLDVLHYRDPTAADRALIADAVVLYRVPATDQILNLVGRIRAQDRPVPILFDVDDLIVDPGVAPELDPILTAAGVDLDLYWQGVRRYRTTLEACDAFIGSTQYLCDRIGALTSMPVHRFANGVGRELARASDAALRRHENSSGAAGFTRALNPRPPFTIGYFSGTNTHNEDWAHIEPAVADLMRARPTVRLHLGGLLEPSEALRPFGSRIVRVPFTAWYDLPARLRELDVNLAPLGPGRTFNEAKSAIKWLEAALVGVPTVATDTQPFREVIVDGDTGLLAGDPDEWLDALLPLVDDPTLGRAVGLRAREAALLQFSPARQGRRYLEVLLAAQADVAARGHRPPSGWIAETLSEPPTPVQLEHYGPLDIGAGGTVRPAAQKTLRQLVSVYREATRTMIADEGLRATIRRALSVGRRLRRAGLVRLRVPPGPR